MRKLLFLVSAMGLFLAFNACSKSANSTTNAKTSDNISGSYKITAILVTANGLTVDEYANLKDCEKDNLIILNKDLTLIYTDAGIVCVPSESSTGTWSLSANSDSLKIYGIPNFPTGVSGYIKSWDGKSLVLSTSQTISGFPAVVTTTMVK